MKVCNMEIKVGGRLLRVARLDADKYHFLSEPEAMIEGLRHAGKRIDLFTFMQGLPEEPPKWKFPFEWDNLAVLPISTFDHWWNKQLGFKARNKAKQAEKRGVTLREVPFDEQLVRGIHEIYNETPIRQGRRFPHYGKDFETVYREEATYLECSTFIGAYFENELVGFIKLVADPSGKQAGLMNIVSKVKHRDKAPTNALMVHAVRACAERRIPHLVYSNFAYGKKQSDSLSDFKERNGFKRVELPRYYVPLTPWGAAAFRMKLHQRLVDRFPEAWGARLREWRNKWNNRRFAGMAEASEA
jgi:hypothetical protein